MSDTAGRVAVFTDYQNVHGWARRQFLPFGADPSDGHVLPLKVGELLASRRQRESELLRSVSTVVVPTPNANLVQLTRATGRPTSGSVQIK